MGHGGRAVRRDTALLLAIGEMLVLGRESTKYRTVVSTTMTPTPWHDWPGLPGAGVARVRVCAKEIYKL